MFGILRRKPPAIPVETSSTPLASVQSPWTGFFGLLVILAGHLVVSGGLISEDAFEGATLQAIWRLRFAIILFAGFLGMLLIEVIWFKVHRRNFDFGTPRALTKDSWRRIGRRTGGFYLLLAMTWLMYAFLRYYDLDQAIFFVFDMPGGSEPPQFYPFFMFLATVTPLLMVLMPLYSVIIERNERMVRTTDEFILAWLVFSRLAVLPFVAVPRLLVMVLAKLSGGRGLPGRWHAALATTTHALTSDLVEAARDKHFKNLLRAWLVKFFYLPLMLTWYIGASERFANHFDWCLDAWMDPSQFGVDVVTQVTRRTFLVLLEVIYLLDLALAGIGYSFSLRLFDTHIRSAEPTLLGWTVALACYPPFNAVIDQYISYGGGQRWMSFMADTPWLFILWAAAIIFFMGFYLFATVPFGLRFSNLTHRGILSRGVYGIIRHPAYISKNIGWWLIAVPFLRDLSDCLALLCWNCVYMLRAYTEEAHLRQDPQYLEYTQKVRYMFIPGIW